MSLESAQLITRLVLSVSLMIQSFELLSIDHKSHLDKNFPLNWNHLQKDFSLSPRGVQVFLRWLYTHQFSKLIYLQIVLLILLIIVQHWILAVFLILSYLLVCARFRGLFNGGSDCMSMTVLIGLLIALLESGGAHLQELGFYYVAFHLTMSYFISGYVKFKNESWRQGTALQVILGYSNYSIPACVRALASNPLIIFFTSWFVILWECSFPIVWFNHALVPYYLIIGVLFHLGNFIFFGLNRFVFAWIAAYPALIFCT